MCDPKEEEKDSKKIFSNGSFVVFVVNDEDSVDDVKKNIDAEAQNLDETITRVYIASPLSENEMVEGAAIIQSSDGEETWVKIHYCLVRNTSLTQDPNTNK